jgi:hypothetical protein
VTETVLPNRCSARSKTLTIPAAAKKPMNPGDGLLTIVRDLRRVPVLAKLNEPFFAIWTTYRDVLARGWKRRGGRRRLLLAAIEHALDLKTWQSLVRERGLSDVEAIGLLVGLVKCT